jgi:hypothetical protein
LYTHLYLFYLSLKLSLNAVSLHFKAFDLGLELDDVGRESIVIFDLLLSYHEFLISFEEIGFACF